MIITVAKGSRIPQAQAAFTEHPRLHPRLLRVVLRMGSPPSPEGTSVVTGHVPWIVRSPAAVTCRADKSCLAHIVARSRPRAWYCWPCPALPVLLGWPDNENTPPEHLFRQVTLR